MDKTEFLSSWSFLRNKRRWIVNRQREKVIGRDKSWTYVEIKGRVK